MPNNDNDVYERIKALVEEEHHLTNTAGSAGERRERREQIEQALDQCWDLLRQRQARRDAGEDPDGARPRPINEVEGYLQ